MPGLSVSPTTCVGVFLLVVMFIGFCVGCFFLVFCFLFFFFFFGFFFLFVFFVGVFLFFILVFFCCLICVVVMVFFFFVDLVGVGWGAVRWGSALAACPPHRPACSANNPLLLGGCLNSEAPKGSTFLALCERGSGIPLIRRVDVPITCLGGGGGP